MTAHSPLAPSDPTAALASSLPSTTPSTGPGSTSPATQPPRSLYAFCRHYTRGTEPWLALMALLTLLPLGTLQLLAAIEHGYAYARSAEFMGKPIVELLVWLRVPGDVVFSIGAVALAWFVVRLWIAPKPEAVEDAEAGKSVL